MKKKIFIFFILIIFIVLIITIIKYNKYKKLLNYHLESVTEINYLLLMKDNKYGVIDKNGNIVIDTIYDEIEIPNPSKDLFICKNNYNTEKGEYNIQVFDGNSKQILYQYYIIDGIKLNNYDGNVEYVPYEKSVLKYKSDNKYGLIDFNGKKITDAIYDSIDGFDCREGLLKVTKNGKIGIININGVSIIKEKYDEIKCDGYYTDKDKFNKSGFIVGIKTNDGIRYGYINSNRKQILKNEYNEIYRITEKIDEKNVYLVAFKNGQAGVYKNKKNIIKNEYEDISYNAYNDLLLLQENSKQGIAKFDGKIIIPIEYDNIIFAGNYITAQKAEKKDIFNADGKKEENSEFVSNQIVCDGKYEIVSTEDGIYKIINKDNNKVIENNYSYIQYLFKNYFMVMKDNLSGIIDSNGNIIIDIKYNSVQLLEDSKVTRIIDSKNNTKLLDENMKEIFKLNNANIFKYDNYIKILTISDVNYIDLNGTVLNNTQIFNNNNLIAFKQNKKWGFKNKQGDIVIDAKYEMVTELDNYGFAGIKYNGKWGVINNNGDIIKNPTYEITTSVDLPIFIGEYYKVDLGYGNPYYTNK